MEPPPCPKHADGAAGTRPRPLDRRRRVPLGNQPSPPRSAAAPVAEDMLMRQLGPIWRNPFRVDTVGERCKRGIAS
jgi:hypothetical protein